MVRTWLWLSAEEKKKRGMFGRWFDLTDRKAITRPPRDRYYPPRGAPRY